MGGIGVTKVGHCHPKVVAAIKDQTKKYIHPCFRINMKEPNVELAERLCAVTSGYFPKKGSVNKILAHKVLLHE
jgi:4-aminobutyrate aminotransferase/(S)-3-amino-2-methylpropionate transaminase